MIKRPLALVSVVFILILSVMYRMELPFLSPNPVNMTENGQKTLNGYLQDDVITFYGVISDYSYQESYGVTTTKLILKDVSILSAVNTKKAASYPDSGRYSNTNYDRSREIETYKKITRFGQSIIVYINKEETHSIGSTVLVSGRLSFFEPATNPGQFDAEKYYKNRDVLFSVKKAEILKGTGGRTVAAGEGAEEPAEREKVGLRQRLKELSFMQEKILETYLSEANATIMKAMLLGNKEELDEEIEKLYQDNGIAHILAISGLHISLLGMAVYRLLRRLPLPVWMPLVLSEIFLLLYGCMVGFPISSIRAIGMFTFFLVSKLLKRSYDMLTALSFMAMFQLLQHPGYLFDCGFQLSYGAILGIGILLPALEKINESVPYPWLRKGISFLLPSTSVTLVTSPILIYHYHEVSFFSILLNVIVLPFMSTLMISAIAMLFLAHIFVPFAKLCAGVVTLILGLYEYSCRFLELFPIGQKNIAMPSNARLIMCFMLLFALTVLVKKKSHPYQFLFAVLSFGLLIFPQNPQFGLWITDIGQGDNSVIFTKEGNCFVIDCGSTTKYRAGERILIPFLKYHGVDNIDAVFVTHADADHMNGVLELLAMGEEENITIERVVLYDKALQTEPEEWEELVMLAKEKEIPIVGMAQDDKVQIDTVTLECLYPLQEQSGLTGNAASLVLSLEVKMGCESAGVSCFGTDAWGTLAGGVSEYGRCDDAKIFRALFTGDLEEDGEMRFLEEYGEATAGTSDKGASAGVRLDGTAAGIADGMLNGEMWQGYDLLKVGHHGSSGSSSEEFLRWVNPKCAVISCGRDNVYGHPHEETLERLEEIGIPYLITYENGAVNFKY